MFYWYLSSIVIYFPLFPVHSHLTRVVDSVSELTGIISVVNVFEERWHGPMKSASFDKANMENVNDIKKE